ncbi:MAG TPA: DUF3606 domain-containing protein [Cyclobacteriaceae bacterium]|jgi:hypothetical protein|nr:DUF3606 domain-containing protein [Cyclobacteriaceae bacterium]
MSDNKNKKYIDGKKIGSERYEIDYWTKKLKVTPQELGGAKRATGSESVSKITKYIQDKKK